MTEGDIAEVEAEGETIGEAKWLGLRELERRFPGLAREQVTFEVLSEGERGLLGVGTAPARILARFDPVLASPPRVERSDSEVASLVRDVLDEIATSLGADCRVGIHETSGAVTATLSGSNVAVLIGKRGKTIDAIQYLVSAMVAKAEGEPATTVIVDAADYRARREGRLAELASRTAERVRETGRPAKLEPMTPVERKIVHLHLGDAEGIETRSEGDEPFRYVVVCPSE